MRRARPAAQEGGTPQASGFDVAIIRDGVIVELYTVLTPVSS